MNPVTLDESQLITRLRAGDEAAVREMMAEYSELVSGFLARSIGRFFSECDLEEIVQDTFLNALRGLKNFRGDSSLKTWLIRIGRNLMLNRMEFNKRRGAGRTDSLSTPLGDESSATIGDLIANDEDVTADIEVSEREAAILRTLKTLPEKDRRIIEMRGVKHQTYEEISAQTGVNIGTVKSRLARARTVLREAMQLQPQAIKNMPDETPAPSPVITLCGCGRPSSHRGRCSARRANAQPKPAQLARMQPAPVEAPIRRQAATVLTDEMLAMHRITEALESLPDARRPIVFKACGILAGLTAA